MRIASGDILLPRLSVCSWLVAALLAAANRQLLSLMGVWYGQGETQGCGEASVGGLVYAGKEALVLEWVRPSTAVDNPAGLQVPLCTQPNCSVSLHHRNLYGGTARLRGGALLTPTHAMLVFRSATPSIS